MALFFFHLRHYFKLNMRIGRMTFVLSLMLFTTLLLIFVMPVLPNDGPSSISRAEPEYERQNLMVRFIFTSFFMLLIPTYLKRLKDLGFRYFDFILIFLFAPIFLEGALSNGGEEYLGKFIAIGYLVGVIFTLYLCFKKGDKEENAHGAAEQTYLP